MAINLFRYAPSKFVAFIKDCKRLFKEFKKDVELVEKVCKKLLTFKPMSQVKFDEKANEACRKNNKEIIERDEDEPTKGGNIDALNVIMADENKQVDASEFTIHNWTNSAQHLVAY